MLKKRQESSVDFSQFSVESVHVINCVKSISYEISTIKQLVTDLMQQ